MTSKENNDKGIHEGDNNVPYVWAETQEGNYQLVVIGETGKSFPLVSVREPFYPPIDSNVTDAEATPQTDKAFWIKLNQTINTAQTDEEKKQALINSLGNIVLPTLNLEIQQALNNNGLQAVISSLTYDDLQHLTDNEIGQIFYIRNKFGYTQPNDELFAGAGILQHRQERFIIQKMRKFVSLIKEDKNLLPYLDSEKDLSKISKDELSTLLKTLVSYCARVYKINPPPVIKWVDGHSSRFTAGTSNSVPSVISFGTAATTKGIVNLINLVGHEVTHAYYINQRFQLNSKQTPTPSSNKYQKLARIFRSKLASIKKYSLLVNSIILKNQSDLHYQSRDISEKYARTAGLAAGIYTAKLIDRANLESSNKKNQTGVLAEIDPESLDVTLEAAIGRHVQKVIGATLREIVTQPGFITSADKENRCELIGTTRAFNALVAFRDLYKNPANDAFHLAAALLNCLPGIMEKGSNKDDPVYRQCYLICAILAKPGMKPDSIEIFKDCFEEAHAFTFCTDPSAFNQHADQEKRRLQAIAKYYPDPLCRKLLLEAAWFSISEPKPPQLKSKLKQFIDITPKSLASAPTTRTTRSRKT